MLNEQDFFAAMRMNAVPIESQSIFAVNCERRETKQLAESQDQDELRL